MTRSCGWPRRADILIENFRPGVMRGLGLDYAALSADQSGARSTRRSPGTARPARTPRSGGFDLVAQGVSGLMSVTGEPGGPPVKVGRAADGPRRRPLRAGRRSSRPCTTAIAPAAASTSTRRCSKPGWRCPSGNRPSTSPAASRRRRSGPRTGSSRRTRRSAAPTATSPSVPARIGCLPRCAPSWVIPEWAGEPDFADAASRVRHRAGARGADRARHAGTSEGALAGAVRRARHSVRADQHLRRRVRRSAGARARHGRRAGSPLARTHAHARLPHQDVGHPAARRAAGAAARRAHS